MRIVTVLGARPQFVKAAVVSHAIAARGGTAIDEAILHTGQHFDDLMSDVFFREMGLPAPRYNLGIGGLPHGAMTGRMTEAIEKILVAERPDALLVYGDTNSTLAGALAAAKLHIPVAHVEAGLRSFNRRMPEEINRVLTDHVSTWLFAPTATAVENLHREGIAPDAVLRVGDVMYDAALHFRTLAMRHSRILESIGVRPGSYVLATIHRAENTDAPERLAAIFAGLRQVAASTPVVVPLHPRTRAALERAGVSASPIRVIDPVGFLDMSMLEQHALAIATDSGGVQKEAYFHGVPCVTLRAETEWVELVAAGANRLVPEPSAEAIALAVQAAAHGARPATGELYGDGHAAEKIVAALVSTAS